jgi:hypothetical protein
MRSRAITHRLAAPLAACLALCVPATAHAAAGPMGGELKKFAPRAVAGKAAIFHVVGVKPSRVSFAYVRSGPYERGVRTRKIKRAAARRSAKMAVRLPKRRVERRHRVRLVVLLKVSGTKPRRPKRDVNAPEPPATDSPTTDLADTDQAEQAPAGAKSTTRPVGSPILSDAEAASHVRRSTWEPRPENDAANHRVPQPGELDEFLSDNISIYSGHKPLVTGNFTGTTDEIIQWAAWKWGLDEDVFRAVAVQESWWRMSAVGDGGLSFGLTQIKTTYHAGTYPLSSTSTAFNADYYGALFRYYYDGHARWLDTKEKGQPYTAGDLWGSIGAHFAGRWHTTAAEDYIARVKRHLDERTWERADF